MTTLLPDSCSVLYFRCLQTWPGSVSYGSLQLIGPTGLVHKVGDFVVCRRFEVKWYTARGERLLVACSLLS